MDWWWLAYLALGSAVGFLAGLLGVGGGALTVPLLVMMFNAQHFPHQHVLHLALGTSLACVIFTSASSLRAHHGHGAVNWQIFRRFAPGIAIGTLLGSLLAGLFPTRQLTMIFVVFIFYAATEVLLDRKPTAHRQLPGVVGLTLVGLGVGVASSLVAAGGAFVTIPFMTWCNVKLREAIGTSASLGFAIAIPGAIGYISTGLHAEGLPPGSLGFIYLPALVCFAVGSITTAPLGANLAHRWPVNRLRKMFAVLLYALALKMLSTLF
jgi:uncharacterized membrane protein YfcA